MKSVIVISLTILTLSFFSCKKSDRDEDKTTNSSTDYASVQSIAANVFKIVHQAALSSKGIAVNNLADTTSLFGCDTLIIDTNTTPMKIDIIFNGVCNDKSGKIAATFTTKYDTYGSTINVSFINYYIGSYPVSGSLTYSYTGIINGIPTYSYNFSSFRTSKGTNFIELNGIQTLEIHAGETTASYSDDTYMVRGTANGITSAGNEFKASIVSDLTLLGNCEWISAGVVNVTPENKSTRVLDFGSGCDNAATVNVYDIKYDIIF
jgi:hypothetical protein